MNKKMSIMSVALAFGILFSVSGQAMDGIQTQPSSDGYFEASLFGARARGEVFTVKISIKNVSAKATKCQFQYKDVYYTDIKNKKKYFALKDSEGRYIAGPQDRESEGGRFERYIDADGQGMIWIKFPAPPASTEVVDVVMPGVLPFEDIAVVR